MTLDKLINKLALILEKQQSIIESQEKAIQDSIKLIEALELRAIGMEEVMAEQLVCQIDMLNNQVAQEEVQAQILLNQIGVVE